MNQVLKVLDRVTFTGALALLDATEAHAFVQGYPYTGFGRVNMADGLIFPSSIQSQERNWNLYWDVRVFAAGGEWHAWRDARGDWRWRLWRVEDPGITTLPLLRTPLWGWGNAIKERDNGWSYQEEGNGARVWLSDQVLTVDHAKLGIEIERRVGYDSSGVAGVIDFRICNFYGR
jgi:hypothetical protein